MAYLAQHCLFEQFAALRAAVDVPPLLGELGMPVQEQNVWWGSAGTVTPLHYDGYDNFLCQIAGYKYVRLYAPSESPRLYPSATARFKRQNVSDIDHLEAADVHEQFPLLREAVFTDHLLGPGDQLFMPRHTWHYVHSLTPSISVNFWF